MRTEPRSTIPSLVVHGSNAEAITPLICCAFMLLCCAVCTQHKSFWTRVMGWVGLLIFGGTTALLVWSCRQRTRMLILDEEGIRLPMLWIPLIRWKDIERITVRSVKTSMWRRPAKFIHIWVPDPERYVGRDDDDDEEYEDESGAAELPSDMSPIHFSCHRLTLSVDDVLAYVARYHPALLQGAQPSSQGPPRPGEDTQVVE